MPRVTRKSLTETASPARMSPRASTKASSTSSRSSKSSTTSAAEGSPKTSRGSRIKAVESKPAEAEEVEAKLPRRNKTNQGDGKDTSVGERGRSRSKAKGKSEEIVEETPPVRGGRSRSRGKPEPVETTTPKSRTRGKAVEQVEEDSAKTSRRSRSKGESKQSKLANTESEEASETVLLGKKKDEIASEDSGVETASPSKGRSRSRGKAAAASTVSSHVEKTSSSTVSESSRSSRSSSRGHMKEKPEEPESEKKHVQAKGRSTSRKRKEEKVETKTSSTRRSGRRSSASRESADSVETLCPISKQANKRKSRSPDQPVVKLTKLSDDVDMKCETKISESTARDEEKAVEKEGTDVMLEATVEKVSGETDKQDEGVPEDMEDVPPPTHKSTELGEQTSMTEDEMKEDPSKDGETEEKSLSADEEATVADPEAKQKSSPVKQEAVIADVKAEQESPTVEQQVAKATVEAKQDSPPVEQKAAVADIEAKQENPPVEQEAAVDDMEAEQERKLDEGSVTAVDCEPDEEPMETQEDELSGAEKSPEGKSYESEKVRSTEVTVVDAETKASDDTDNLELPVSLSECSKNTSIDNRKRKFESDELTDDLVAKKICMNKEIVEEVSKEIVQEAVIEGISDVSSAEDEGSSSQNGDVLATSQRPETTQSPLKSTHVFSEISLAVEGKANSLETEQTVTELKTQNPDDAEEMETEAVGTEVLGEDRVADVSLLQETPNSENSAKGLPEESVEAAATSEQSSSKETKSESATHLSETVEKSVASSLGVKEQEVEEEDVTAGYVLVSLDDVPPADSCELPETSTIAHNHTEPVKQAQQDSLRTEAEGYAVSTEASKPGNGVHSTTPVNNGIETSQSTKVVRTFEPSPDIFHRFCMSNPSVSKESVAETHKFKLASYNILAECHRQRYDYSYTPEEFLCQDYRHELLLKELLYLDADVVCLQEVNPSYYSTRLLPALKSSGYEGTFMKRTQLKYDEGEATFYRTARFDLESSRGVSLAVLAKENISECGLSGEVKEAVENYLDRADVVNVCRLRCTRTNKIITVGNIHILHDEFESPDVQSIQIACAVKEVISQAGSDKNPYIICGDFNSAASSVGYQLATDGYLSDSNIATLQSIENLKLQTGSKSLINHLWGAFQHTSSNLTSAYLTCQGEEPEVTTYNSLMLEGVDYVFYGSIGLGVQDILQVVDKDVVEDSGGIPNKDFPSDHLSLRTTLFFK